MRLLITLAITMTAATAIFAQQPFMPCVADVQTYTPPSMEDLQRMSQRPAGAGFPEFQRPAPIWQLREAFLEPAIKINPLDAYRIAFFMPTAGRCIGAFDAYADLNEAANIARQMLGQYTGVPMSKPTGDVEIMIMTAYEFDAWQRGRSTSTRGGTRGLATGGRFDADLGPGWHYLVISNRHSGFTAKTVSLMFGGKAPERKM